MIVKKKSTGTVAAKPKQPANAKARSKAKRPMPVLTSPWKIGVLVSLLLVLVGIGVGAYLAVLHRIEFPWLAISREGIRFDSYGFFRQMYPLFAGLVATALVSYFLVVSAVRKYRCYLDSGQDYRTMISLAESIDDLTNPAQIARLSSYPELQSVLRSYGDQIREISNNMSTGDESTEYGDLETDVEALIGGAEAAGSALEAKPYAAVLRRISDLRTSHRAQIDELEKRDETERRAHGTAALACGRIAEAAMAASGELLGITKATGELAHAARGLASSAAGRREPSPAGARGSAAKARGLESGVRKLEEGGQVLGELAEENNGIAIGLALMAARGAVEQHDLAAFAERVRVTAERFQKLSAAVAGIARELAEARREIEGSPQAADQAAPAAQARLMQTIQEIAAAVEDRCARLDERLRALTGEAREARGLLRGDAAEEDILGSPGADDARRANDFAPGAEAGELNIDRGTAWSGMMDAAQAADEEERPATEREEEPASSAAEPTDVEPRAETDAPAAEEPASRMRDFSDMSSLRNLDASGSAAEAQQAPQGGEGGWMEMPGHSWRPVTVENADAGVAEETEEIPVAVRASAKSAPAEQTAEEDDDPIYDLSELGAVECVAETQAQR